jgi:hypothetical protein
MPTRTPDAVEDQIVGLRRVQRCGPDGIGAELGATTRTVSRVLRRRGVRYKRGRRGELVHVDVKWWAAYLTAAAGAPTVTQTCEIESVSKAMDSTTCIQSFTTRLAYSDSELLPVEKGTTCAPFLHCAAGYFRDHSITHIERVMTDNAWAYRLPIAPSVRRAGRPPGVHQTALQLAERKGRTPQPHPANRVGLPTGLHQ